MKSICSRLDGQISVGIILTKRVAHENVQHKMLEKMFGHQKTILRKSFNLQ